MKHLLPAFLFLLGAHMLPAAVPGAEALAKLITCEFDTNSDEILDQGEWQSGIADSFGKLDSDGDGSIKPDDVDGLSEDIVKESGEIGDGIIVALIKQALLSLDTDGDKSVSRKEYGALSDSIFAKLDTDKNASLTLTELAGLPATLIAN